MPVIPYGLQLVLVLRPHSLTFRHQTLFDFLRARAFLLRDPQHADGWLAILERHLADAEDPEVWRALAYHLQHLVSADRSRAIAFFVAFFERYPEILRTLAGVRLIAHIRDWMPAEFTNRIVQDWICDEWSRGAQAAGEITALALCRDPGDPNAKELVERFLVGSDYDAKVTAKLQLGLMYTLVAAWREPTLRELTTPLLLRMLPTSKGPLAEALHGIFSKTSSLIPDEWTRELLEAFLRHPQVLNFHDGAFVVDRLKELLGQGWNPQLIQAIARVLVDQAGRELSDLRTSWAGAAKDLVEIALTLHRLPETRTSGLDLFERLMTANAYGVVDQLGILDRRPFRTQ